MQRVLPGLLISALSMLLAGCGKKAEASREGVGIAYLCSDADLAFIGTIVATDTRDDEDPYGFVTYVTFNVERSVQGTSAPTEVVWVRGGKIGPLEEYVSGYPFPVVGDRYAFALGALRSDGTRAIIDWKQLDEEVLLPPQHLIDSTAAANCP